MQPPDMNAREIGAGQAIALVTHRTKGQKGSSPPASGMLLRQLDNIMVVSWISQSPNSIADTVFLVINEQQGKIYSSLPFFFIVKVSFPFNLEEVIGDFLVPCLSNGG